MNGKYRLKTAPSSTRVSLSMFSGNLVAKLRLMTFEQVCEKIAASLEMSRVVSKAVDPVARSFSMGRVSGLEEALRILQAEQAARIKGEARVT